MYFELMLFRTIILYFLIAIIIRFLGKREVGQLAIFDLIILLIIANISSIVIENEDISLLSIVFVLIFLALLQKFISFISLKLSFLRNFFDGSDSIIVFNGKINVKEMKKNLYSIDDLILQMRQNKIINVNEIKIAILETNGRLSIFKKNETFELPVIISGKIQKKYLKYLNLEEKDIFNYLKKYNYKLKDILYLSYDLKNFSLLESLKL